jgi:hypothetical protein
MPEENRLTSFKNSASFVGEWSNGIAIYLLIGAMFAQRKKAPEKLVNFLYKSSWFGWGLTGATRGINNLIDLDQREARLDAQTGLSISSIGLTALSFATLPSSRLAFTRACALSALNLSSIEKVYTKYSAKKEWSQTDKIDIISQCLNIFGLSASIPTRHLPKLSSQLTYMAYGGWAASAIPNCLVMRSSERNTPSHEKMVAGLGAVNGAVSLGAVAAKKPFAAGITSLVALSSKVYTNLPQHCKTDWRTRIINERKLQPISSLER